LKSIRVHGQGETRYEHVRLGITGRLDSIQAAVLLEKLAIFADELDARERAAKQYSERIAARGLDLITPKVPEGSRSAWAQYCLLARDGAHRDACQASLKAAGVPTMIYYPLPLHLQPAFAGLGYRAGDFPLSEDAARRIFAIPMHPYLEDARICSIADGLV
jgi:UDP-2-acetamido-2-deoxy-ribo-hexuluronate aminotransferase